MLHRVGHSWTANKLEFLQRFLPEYTCSGILSHPMHYVDGFAGPGKNTINEREFLGSPLIALNQSFDSFHFVERNKRLYESLKEQCRTSPKFSRIQLHRDNINRMIPTILSRIPTENNAFFLLDPEGLELKWSTVSQIGQRNHADIFVLISSSGIVRNLSKESCHTTISNFFGNEEWRKVLNGHLLLEKLFDWFTQLYISRLESLGFITSDRHITAITATNTHLHSLVFASKNLYTINLAQTVLGALVEPPVVQPALFSF